MKILNRKLLGAGLLVLLCIIGAVAFLNSSAHAGPESLDPHYPTHFTFEAYDNDTDEEGYSPKLAEAIASIFRHNHTVADLDEIFVKLAGAQKSEVNKTQPGSQPACGVSYVYPPLPKGVQFPSSRADKSNETFLERKRQHIYTRLISFSVDCSFQGPISHCGYTYDYGGETMLCSYLRDQSEHKNHDGDRQ